MPIYHVNKSCLADEISVRENKVSLVREDRRFALILCAAQTQQSKMRCHVAIPLRARQTLEIVFSDVLSESV